MYNDFVVVGPPDDPAGVGKTKDAPDAFRAISSKGSPFLSRGDESGTHVKEKEVWASAGIVPRGAWYIEAGQGMGEVLTMAAQKRGYALADRGTYIAFRKKTDLVVLRAGGPEPVEPVRDHRRQPEEARSCKIRPCDEAHRFRHGTGGALPHRGIQGGRRAELFFVTGEGGKN